jgi:hypothetical protein
MIHEWYNLLLKSLLLVSLDLERCFHQISACCLHGSWFTVIWHNLSTLFAHEILVLWKVSFSKTWNRSCTLHSFCHKLGTIGIWPVCQLIVMISSSPACTYSSRWSWTLVPLHLLPAGMWSRTVKDCGTQWTLEEIRLSILLTRASCRWSIHKYLYIYI